MPVGIQLFIPFVLGGLLGLLIGWLYGRGRPAAPADSRLEYELRQQLAQRGTELNQLRSQLTETGNARAAAADLYRRRQRRRREERSICDAGPQSQNVS